MLSCWTSFATRRFVPRGRVVRALRVSFTTTEAFRERILHRFTSIRSLIRACPVTMARSALTSPSPSPDQPEPDPTSTSNSQGVTPQAPAGPTTRSQTRANATASNADPAATSANGGPAAESPSTGSAATGSPATAAVNQPVTRGRGRGSNARRRGGRSGYKQTARRSTGGPAERVTLTGKLLQC